MGNSRSEVKQDVLTIGKTEFVLFMVEVINCSGQTDKKTEKIKIIVKAAEKYLGIKGLSWQTVEGNLSGRPTSTQACTGGSSWS